MNKAFVKESDEDDDDLDIVNPPIPPGSKNYMTPGGHAQMMAELDHLTRIDRPQVVATVSWAAKNGDRSENGDYIYGKKRLREIDRRTRFLVKRLDTAEVIDPSLRAAQENSDQIFFGATVVYADAEGLEHRISIVGIDETDASKGYVSWVSPIARALTRAREGDTVSLRTPSGVLEIEVISVHYVPLLTGTMRMEQ